MQIVFTGIRKSDNQYYTLDGDIMISSSKYSKMVDSKEDLTDLEFDRLLDNYKRLVAANSQISLLVSELSRTI